jgi:hypothetical protein
MDAVKKISRRDNGICWLASMTASVNQRPGGAISCQLAVRSDQPTGLEGRISRAIKAPTWSEMQEVS